jgi:hypothetical protein
VNVSVAYKHLRENIEYFHIKDMIKESGAIVPAGRGDARIRMLVSGGGRHSAGVTFLSVEPHLTAFDGLGQLQETELVFQHAYPSGEEAFGAAVTALKLILTEEGFLTKNSGGFEVWVR